MYIQPRIAVALATDVRLDEPDGASAGERIEDWMPEVDDEVVVAFEHADPRAPYIVGSLWNDDDKPPAEAPATGTRHHRVDPAAKPL